MKRFTLLLSLLVLIGIYHPAAAHAMDSPYTLDELYRTALAHAEQIGIAQEAVAIAEYTRKQALSVLMPTVTAFGNFRRYSEEKSAGTTTLQPLWDSNYGVRLGQSFTLNGRELTALRIAEQGIDQRRADLDSAKATYLFNVASAFFDVAKTQQALEIAKANVMRLQTHKNAVSTRLKLGDVAKTELFRTEAELAGADADLIQAQNGLHLARAFLGRLTGLESSFEIVEPQSMPTRLESAGLDGLKRLADTNRTELKSLDLGEAIATNTVTYTKGAFWPRLSVEGAWMRLEQDPDPYLYESSYLGVGVTFDLFDGGLRRSRVSESRARRKQADLALKDARRVVAIEVEQAWRNWQTQKSVIHSFESGLSYATENYAAVIRLFAHGMANSVDVMDANTLLLTAQRQLSESRYNLQLSALEVERSAGVFLAGIRERLEL
jgi:outer membrane protein